MMTIAPAIMVLIACSSGPHVWTSATPGRIASEEMYSTPSVNQQQQLRKPRQAQKSAESMETAFARMPGAQASSGAPVIASAQATTGAEAQKSVSYGQVTSMATVVTGANDVVTSLLLSGVAVSAYGVTS